MSKENYQNKAILTVLGSKKFLCVCVLTSLIGLICMLVTASEASIFDFLGVDSHSFLSIIFELFIDCLVSAIGEYDFDEYYMLFRSFSTVCSVVDFLTLIIFATGLLFMFFGGIKFSHKTASKGCFLVLIFLGYHLLSIIFQAVLILAMLVIDVVSISYFDFGKLMLLGIYSLGIIYFVKSFNLVSRIRKSLNGDSLQGEVQVPAFLILINWIMFIVWIIWVAITFLLTIFVVRVVFVFTIINTMLTALCYRAYEKHRILGFSEFVLDEEVEEDVTKEEV